ncbi:hypothetical protein PFICI_01079 [Pestalotiopsis fici W106-1]|uniref:Uncharacterized protein n=1 Tax=Pestalotiopsis fici (strain W106-1 / CGMCC3.15140) TaxID=1229662 RepID=W3XPU3_PESFW|nr:uncharacterized protein PFICI_01079 [Pestalotiopsis fici W106-1]ETS87251.1 hypothetical protein PFICI_01079 [Pestalotiopsis fici W106-1]
MPGGDGTPLHMAKFILAQLFTNAPKPTTSFAGQTIIITGSNTGLGYEGAKHVLTLGCAKLIIAVRSVEKGETAKRSLVQATHVDPSIIEVWPMDLASYESVQAFAERADRELERLDVLLENAGVASVEWNTVRDNERMVTVNVVSTFLLAFLLLPKLRATAARYNVKTHLTIVTSDTHFLIDFKEAEASEGIFNRLNNKEKSAGEVADRYPTTKLMQVFLVRELAARLPLDSNSVIINCTNPGMCHSELSREIDSLQVRVLKFILARTSEQGSRNLVAGACGGAGTHGQYLDVGKVRTPATVVVGPGGEERQKRLYDELVKKLEKIVPGVTTKL